MQAKRIRHKYESGFTLIEMVIVLGLGSVIIAGLLSQYSSTATLSYDQNIKMSANLQVQAILQSIGAELRVLGNGVPFDQADFEIGENTLTDPSVTQPIDTATATATHISYRINETGQVYLLTQDFDPTISLDVVLTSVDDLGVNDPIYISDSVMSGDDGFYGTIDSIDTSTNTVTLSATYEMSPSAIFVIGSILEAVPLVAVNSPSDGSGITRDSGYGTVSLGAGSTFTLEYLDWQGNVLTLPLTNAMMVGSLRTIRVTVSMPGSKNLSTGEQYTATATQSFALRNLNYVF